MRSRLQAVLGELSPGELRNHRQRRYQGDDLCLPMGAFCPADQVRLREIYVFLSGLLARLREQLTRPADDPMGLGELLSGPAVSRLIGAVGGLGAESLAADPGELMAKTMHDLRGGAMSALLGWLQVAVVRPPDAEGRRRLFFLTRDHLKIMRNAVLGLDDERRAADLNPRMHGTDLIVEKWGQGMFGPEEAGTLELVVECDFQGQIADCCVEFAALDRVLYNLANNAARHRADGEIGLFILPETVAGRAENLRFIVVNRVHEADARRLAGADLAGLFAPGVSSTGSGYGMTVAADFVSNAFGISREQALEEGYLGARLWQGYFLAWFHWPILADV